jgi:hypothetical protein
MPEGYYRILVSYQPRFNVALIQSTFGIYFNETKLTTILPLNFTNKTYTKNNLIILQNNSNVKIKL